MSDNMRIKCKVKMTRQLYPKYTPLKAGEYGIVRAKVVEEIDGIPLTDDNGCIVIKGNMCELDFKMPYTICAEGEKNDKYNSVSYKITYISSDLDFTSERDKQVFLKSILTEKQYEALVSKFEDPCAIINERDVSSLIKVKGIGETTALKLIDKYHESIAYAKILVQLGNYGLTHNVIQKLLATYNSPETVIEIINNDIYRIAEEVDGMGFLKCDEIAIKGGMKKDDPRRIKAFIKHTLREEGEIGNSWSYTQYVVNKITDTLQCYDEQLIITALKELLESEIIWANPDRSVIALTKYYKLEIEIAKELKRIYLGKNTLEYGNWKEIIRAIESVQGWNYTAEQTIGIKTVLDSQLSVVTGLAGCGKTAVTNAMVKILSGGGYKIIQCALSGRAAQKMKEYNGLDSNTIHKTLGCTGWGTYLYHENNKLEADVILLDEASMVNGDMFLRLLKAIKTGTKLVIIGDKGQLPSIGNCNVFFDLMEMGVPVVELTVVHRQAEASAIISKSVAIRKQKQLFDRNYVGTMTLGDLQDLELNIYSSPTLLRQVIVQKFKENYMKVNGDIMKVQIVVPVRSRGEICTYMLNTDIQALLMKGKTNYIQSINYKYFVGDKVINVKNKMVVSPDGETLPLFNGNIGVVESIDTDTKTMVVDFGEKIGKAVFNTALINSNLELAYAITCHKLQGSSASRVIVGCDFSAYSILTAEWLYTAITRAEEFCTVVSTTDAIRYAISKVITDKKRTFLQFIERIDTWSAA